MGFSDLLATAKCILKLTAYIIFYFFKEKCGHRKFEVESVDDRMGQVAIVTGGGRGIGLQVTKGLLRCGMKVVIASRSAKSCEAQLNKFIEEYNCSGSFECMTLDLSSMKSVSQFVDDFKQKYHYLHLLINNAGIMITPFSLTVDSFESQLCVNYLGHFLLSHLLLPQLKKGSSEKQHGRIVNVTSLAHYAGAINFEDLMSVNWYNGTQAYTQSKLAQVISTVHMNKLLKSASCNIDCYCVHPGIVSTELYEHIPFGTCSPVLDLMFKSPAQGADPALFAALDDSMEGEGGKYIENSLVEQPNPLATDKETQQKLYQVTKQLLNIPADLQLL